MSDEADTSGAGVEESADKLLQAGEEVRRKRGRPPGSKNRAKDGTPNVSQSNQKVIFAGAIMALFSLLGIVLGWFGYEYYNKLEMKDAEEGGTHLIPIAQKVGWIAAGAFYLSFPSWLLVQITQRFRTKVDPAEAAGSRPPVSTSPDHSAPRMDGAPADGEAGFRPAVGE